MTYIVMSVYTSLMHYVHKKLVEKSDDYKSNIKCVTQYTLTCQYIMLYDTNCSETNINKQKEIRQRSEKMRAKKERMECDRFGLLVDTPRLMELCCTGRPKAVEIGTEAGARVQLGRSVLWNVKKVQEYIDRMSGR